MVAGSPATTLRFPGCLWTRVSVLSFFETSIVDGKLKVLREVVKGNPGNHLPPFVNSFLENVWPFRVSNVLPKGAIPHAGLASRQVFGDTTWQMMTRNWKRPEIPTFHLSRWEFDEASYLAVLAHSGQLPLPDQSPIGSHHRPSLTPPGFHKHLLLPH